MALATVQTAKYVPGSVGGTIPFTLGSAPTNGNILVAVTSYSQYRVARTISAPDGTWTKAYDGTSGNDSLAIWWKPVLAGAGTTYTFTISDATEWESGIIYEIQGASTTAPLPQGVSNGVTSASSYTTSSLTPSVLGMLPLIGISIDQGTYTGISSVSTGWTFDQYAEPSYHATATVLHSALTTDTTTALACTVAFDIANSAMSWFVLIAPPGGASTPSIASWLSTTEMIREPFGLNSY